MIGECVKMQTTSWEDEMELLKGISYEINFFRDFSSVCLDGTPVERISISSLIESIVNFHNADADWFADSTGDYGQSQIQSQKFWKSAQKQSEKERRKEEKWKNRYRPGKREAERNFDKIWNSMMNGGA